MLEKVFIDSDVVEAKFTRARPRPTWTLEAKVWPYTEDTLREADQKQYKIIGVKQVRKTLCKKII